MGSRAGTDKELSACGYNKKMERETMPEKTPSHEIHPSQLRDVEGIIFSYPDSEEDN